MINDPCAWGSDEPEVLVLGFSKGFTQAKAIKEKPFEEIPFAGMRPRLNQALRAMRLLESDRTVAEIFGDPNSKMAFGSLVRCSLSRLDENASHQKGTPVYSCTGPIITKSFKEIPEVISECAKAFLTNLPASLRVIVLLGNSDEYVRLCRQLIRSLYPDSFSSINSMAVRADGRIWAHLAHPSGLNGHFENWLSQDIGPGIKRREAQLAIQDA